MDIPNEHMESLRELAKRLVAEHRQRRDDRKFLGILAQLESRVEQDPLSLTENDIKWLRSVRIDAQK